MARARGRHRSSPRPGTVPSRHGSDTLHGERFYAGLARAHAWLVVRSGGRPVHLTPRLRCLVLETTGRRSNQSRRVPLLFMPDGDAYVVLASNFGREKEPSWWKNLQGRPEASVWVGGHVIPVRARQLDGHERQAVMERATAYNKQWRSYSTRLHRDLPVIRLEPVRTETSPR